MDSPYERNQYRKKNTSKTQPQTHTTSELPKNTKNNKKNKTLKGGIPNDVHMSGREQAFQDDKKTLF